ncbi:MAG: sodium/solute symporter [Phycisphaerales bacterium]
MYATLAGAGHLLATWDWIIIALYGLGMVWVGVYYSRKTNSSEDYLLGGRDMKPSAVGLSLFATLFSTITYLSIPGEMMRFGPIVLAGLLAYPLIYYISGWLLIPVFMRLNVTSCYELLEIRLGKVVRIVGVLIFISLRLLWMAVVVYATSDVVLVPLAGLNPSATPWVCAALALVTIAYTSMGGLRAVVVTDVIQTLLLFAGAVISLVLVTWSLGGVSAWWPKQWHASWGEVRWVYDPSGQRSVLGAFVAVLVWYVCTAGSDQVAIQRYLATRDAAAARRVMGVSLIAGLLVQVLLACLGMALFTYFAADPARLPAGETLRGAADKLFPSFIVSGLPVGLSGLVIAGLLAAAMSSLSSGISALCSVIATDLLGQARDAEAGPSQAVRRDRIISVLIGLTVVVISMGVGFIEGNLLDLAYKVVNLFVVPLFGLFFMAIFIRWATAFGTLVGVVGGLGVIVPLNYWRELTGGDDPPIGFLWAMPLGLVVQVVVGIAASLLPVGETRPMIPRDTSR